jgi:hypothetical protein
MEQLVLEKVGLKKVEKAEDLSLSEEFYAISEKHRLTFSQLLEKINPSTADDTLDAFERQCKRFGIILKDVPERGIYASTGDMFFQSNQPASRILFPEFLNRVARISLLEDYDLNWIIANTRNIDSGAFRSLYIEDTAANRRKARVTEMSGFPTTKVTWSEEAGSVYKNGIRLLMSYEFVRRASIPMISLVISRVLLQSRRDDFADAINVLVNGDDHATTANPAAVSTLTSLDAAAVAGTLTYKGYLKFGNLFRPYRMTTAIGTIDTILQVVLCAKPSTDPIQLFALLQEKGTKLGENITVVNPAWSNVSLIIHDDAPTDKLIGLDKRYALERITEIGADLQETNKIINGQFDEIVLSESSNFSKLFTSACKILNIGA